MNFIKKHLKNERGLTLIELLAVVVILGIIAAIAIPSIGGLINNSKKDAHIANAQQMVSGARTAVAGNDAVTFTTTAANGSIPASTTAEITLQKLETNGYIEEVDDPSKGGYDKEKSKVIITKLSNGSFKYVVNLVGPSSKAYIKTAGSETSIPEAKNLKRDNIDL